MTENNSNRETLAGLANGVYNNIKDSEEGSDLRGIFDAIEKRRCRKGIVIMGEEESYSSSAVRVIRYVHYLKNGGAHNKDFLKNPEKFFHEKIKERAYSLYEDSGVEDSDTNWFKARDSLVDEIVQYADIPWSGFSPDEIPVKI